MAKAKSGVRKTAEALRAFALGLPGAVEDFPWGERVMKVNKKVFVFMGKADGEWEGLGVKLPHSGALALALPSVEPAGYGLGKSGWVSARIEAGAIPPIDMLEEWIEESYRAVAPKRLVAELDARKAAPSVRSQEGKRRRRP
jgi:predicted DNA-binding protein (MmcQ/YjbR family)